MSRVISTPTVQFSRNSISYGYAQTNLLELGSYASLCDATDEINILLVGMLHDGDTSI